MNFDNILIIIILLVSFVLATIAKKYKYISNNLIPIQNTLVGLIVAIIEWIITKDFEVALALSGVIAGGTYDVVHNLQKLRKGD